MDSSEAGSASSRSKQLADLREAIQTAEDYEPKINDMKLSDLWEQHKDMQQQAKRVAMDMKNERRKRSRLLSRVRLMEQNDLLEAWKLRFESDQKRKDKKEKRLLKEADCASAVDAKKDE